MAESLGYANLLKQARVRARLTQRELARRARTSQSVVARIESGRTSPTVETLLRLLETAGYELRSELLPRPVIESQMLDDSARILRLSPEERLREVSNISRFVTAARPWLMPRR